jgi:hypothetical protein
MEVALYHATPAANVERILCEGLRPMPSRYADRTASRPGYLYLATALEYAREYALDMLAEGVEPAIFEIDSATRLDVDRWSADEDHFEHHPYCEVDATTGRVAIPLPAGEPGVGVPHPSHYRYAYEHFGFDRPSRKERTETLAAWAERWPLSRPDVVRYSAQRGSVAYRGAVPRARIRLLTGAKVSLSL